MEKSKLSYDEQRLVVLNRFFDKDGQPCHRAKRTLMVYGDEIAAADKLAIAERLFKDGYLHKETDGYFPNKKGIDVYINQNFNLKETSETLTEKQLEDLPKEAKYRKLGIIAAIVLGLLTLIVMLYIRCEK